MVKVIGPHRTGSTIIQNIGYFIINKKQGRLLKNHNFELNKHTKYLVTIRDPREMVISIYKKMIIDTNEQIIINDLSFIKNGRIKNDLDNLVKIYNNHKNDENSLILKFEELYENGFGNYDIAIKKISKFLNIEITDLEYNHLYSTLNFEKLKKISNTIGTFKSHDVNTTGYGLHGGHINSNNVNTWKEIIDVSLHEEYNNLLKKYIKETDYE